MIGAVTNTREPKHKSYGSSSSLHSALTALIDRLDSPAMAGMDVIKWGCPVVSFGDLANSRVATLGLNPSNREFVDEQGHELKGQLRRFHTLSSLGIKSWADVDARHLSSILESCRDYFLGNPYDSWFKRLDLVVSAANASFYDAECGACHLDLIPYATVRKWTELTNQQRSSLLDLSADTLALLLRDSPVRVLLLNGQSVVAKFQEISGITLERKEMADWGLPREQTPDVTGYAYKGTVNCLSGISLGHELLVLGYNHNLQSSFGVTTKVIRAIRDWVAAEANGASA
jgi:hypothetical protein